MEYKYLRVKLFKTGIWWVILPRFKCLNSFISRLRKDRTREYRIRDNCFELFNDYGKIIYELHKQTQLTMLIILIAICFGIGISFNFRPESALVCFAIVIGGIIVPDKKIIHLASCKRTQIDYYFPDVLNRVAILTDSGLNIKQAIEKLILDNRKNALQIELYILVNDFNKGVSDKDAFESFTKRCGTVMAANFSSLILQNIRKGNSELSLLLKAFAEQCLERKFDMAKKRGEEINAKLMIPAVIIFIATMVLLSAPAVMSMNIN